MLMEISITVKITASILIQIKIKPTYSAGKQFANTQVMSTISCTLVETLEELYRNTLRWRNLTSYVRKVDYFQFKIGYLYRTGYN